MTVANPLPSDSFSSPLGNGLVLELPAEILDATPEPCFSTAGAAERAWLNRMTLVALQTWLSDEMSLKSKAWPNERTLPSQWELVNGTALTVNDKRWVIIPDIAIDQRELRVPQEWVDIPDWAGDYYLAVQVNLDEGWLRIWGYASHLQLKAQGSLDLTDRHYSLDEDQLLSNFNALWLAQDLTFSQPLRASIAEPEAPLAIAQANQLIERLGQDTVTFPRLSTPFDQWSRLISHNGWRQRLYEQRQGITEQRSILEWLREGVSEIGEQIGWQTGSPALIPALAMRGDDTATEPALSREIVIAGQALVLSITRRPGEIENAWRFILCPIEVNTHIPAGTILRLLSENLEPFPHNEDTATENCTGLYVDVVLEPSEGIIWETEPTAEDHVQEILKF